ncbi:MAG: UDP-N-acetylmuramoyl-L-alanine--D-glutamate ligase [Candidatus Saccharimonadales bacterium]
MRIGIVGWGVEGQSVYRFYGPEHSYLIVNEEPRDDFPAPSDKTRLQYLKSERPIGMVGSATDLSYLDGLGSCDKVVYSPSSYKNLRKAYGDDRSFWDKATTAQNIFFENSRTKNIIGVTGTKGKGTTSTLIAKILEAQGTEVHFGGNIGKSVLDLLRDIGPEDWVVLELSSFQLQSFTYSPHIAVCLTITKEHMDWHAGMQEYLDAKANLFRHQSAQDIAIYFAKDENSKKIAAASPGKKIPYFEKPGAFVRDDGMIVIGENETEIIHKTEVKLLGEHNLQNICAALTAVVVALKSLDPFDSAKPRSGSTLSGKEEIGYGANSKAVEWVDKAKAVLSSFSGLEHRLELVRSLQGVKYYDDSFATTPDAAIVALKAFKEPKVVILGGSDKGLPFEQLADEVTKSNVRHAIVVGDTAEKISTLLKDRGYSAITLGLEKMTDIVAAASRLAQPGDVVLLSTGCASFGLFRDYKDRGNQFKEAVRALV